MASYKRLPESRRKINIHHSALESATIELINRDGTVYRDELQNLTGLNSEIVTMWLKREGFVKPGYYASKRWVNREWKQKVKTHENLPRMPCEV